MPPDMKRIILTNMNVKLHGWLLSYPTDCGGVVAVLIQASFTDPFWS